MLDRFVFLKIAQQLERGTDHRVQALVPLHIKPNLDLALRIRDALRPYFSRHPRVERLNGGPNGLAIRFKRALQPARMRHVTITRQGNGRYTLRGGQWRRRPGKPWSAPRLYPVLNWRDLTFEQLPRAYQLMLQIKGLPHGKPVPKPSCLI